MVVVAGWRSPEWVDRLRSVFEDGLEEGTVDAGRVVEVGHLAALSRLCIDADVVILLVRPIRDDLREAGLWLRDLCEDAEWPGFVVRPMIVDFSPGDLSVMDEVVDTWPIWPVAWLPPAGRANSLSQWASPGFWHSLVYGTIRRGAHRTTSPAIPEVSD